MMRSGQDAFRPIWEDTNPTCPEGSGVTNEQINWLDNALLANAGLKKIVVLHHPPVNAVGTNADGSPSTGTVLDPADGSIISNREGFLDLCENAHADMTLSGHVHQNVVASRNGTVVNENWAGGTRYIQTGACEYGNYRVITVDSNFVYAGDPQQLFSSGICTPANADGAFKVYFDKRQQNIFVKLSDSRQSGIAELSLYSSGGILIMNQRTELCDGRDFAFDVTGIAAGLYFVTINGNGFTAAQKVAVY
jgi:3',5'-cyclic AMP phosphodiesterase CpdA